MFLYLVNRFAQEEGANNPDAPIIRAALCNVENLLLHQYPDQENIHKNDFRFPASKILSSTDVNQLWLPSNHCL
jgi:hypothetical protein